MDERINKIRKLVLGTVQFGCDYGIHSAGRPDRTAVAGILDEAARAGIHTLDTSSAYGNAEEVIGRAARPEFRIISKYPKGSADVRSMFAASLARLGQERLYGYLLHHFDLYQANPACWEAFCALKEDGLVERIGFSLYHPRELERILADGIPFDLVQIPRNVLDRQFDPYLPALHRRGVEVHVRSTFLQGLFFLDRDALPERLRPLRKYLLEMDAWAAGHGISTEAMALNANLQHPCIDGVLIGVDNRAQLQADLRAVCDIPVDWEPDVAEKDLLNPVNWH